VFFWGFLGTLWVLCGIMVEFECERVDIMWFGWVWGGLGGLWWNLGLKWVNSGGLKMGQKWGFWGGGRGVLRKWGFLGFPEV